MWGRKEKKRSVLCQFCFGAALKERKKEKERERVGLSLSLSLSDSQDIKSGRLGYTARNRRAFWDVNLSFPAQCTNVLRGEGEKSPHVHVCLMPIQKGILIKLNMRKRRERDPTRSLFSIGQTGWVRFLAVPPILSFFWT